MEILVSIGAKIAEYFVAPVKHCVCLFLDSKPMVDELRNECQQLELKRSQLSSECELAINRNGEEIEEPVSQWFKDTEETLIVATRFLESVGDQNTMSRHCPNNWCQSYGQNKEARREKDKIESLLKQRGNMLRFTRPQPAKGIQLMSRVDVSIFYSVDDALRKIMDALEDIGTTTIGVCGMGGIGKTTLVNEVGHRVGVKVLFNIVLQAVVSQSPDICKIQTELGEQLSIKYTGETEYGRAGQLSNRMKRDEKILVILDDVWMKIDLGKIGIPFGKDHSGCKLILTTRREQVCRFMDCQETIPISLLEEDEAWMLFKKNVGTSLDDPAGDLNDVAKQVCNECGRLPLALVVVGCAMRDKSLLQWKLAANKLQRSRLEDIEGLHPEKAVYGSIQLSYDFLKANVTKKCFLLCSLFPEDHEIDIGELVLYAAGLGLLDEDGVESFTSAKDNIECIVKDLVESNLLMTNNSRSRYVRMHDVVRDATLWMTSEGEDVFLVPISSDMTWTRSGRFANATIISLLSCPNNRQFPDKAACPRLKMILLAQRVPLTLRANCFQGRISLRVLDLTVRARCPLELELPASLQDLSNLRALFLRRWKLKGDLSMIGSLSNLEFLSFSGSIIAEFPMAVEKLYELRVLDLSGSEGFSSYNQVLKYLSNLEEIFPPNKPMQVVVDED